MALVLREQQQMHMLQLIRAIASRTSLAFLAGALLVGLARKVHDLWLRLRQAKAEFMWRRHVDFSVVQACVLSTEHLQSLGRVEKRTLFVKPITEVFRNEYILARVLEAAEKASASKDPILTTKLSAEDKWHVLNTCTNHISSCFAPYHIFFNEARRVKSYYKSAWYCFTITCAQTEACGRWFITPLKPVSTGADCGILRIRVVLMNEQELRDIAAGTVEAPTSGMFNGRHESRWQVCQRFADLFARQLYRVAGANTQGDWGKNLCGRMSRQALGMKVASHGRLSGLESLPVPEYEPEDNSILRIHIPFPSTAQEASMEACQTSENVSRDVVLFE